MGICVYGSVYVCVCMCLCLLLICEYRCLCTCVYMYVEVRGQCLHLDHSPPYFFFLRESLTESGIHQFSQTADFYLSPQPSHQCWDYTELGFSMGAGDLNSALMLAQRALYPLSHFSGPQPQTCLCIYYTVPEEYVSISSLLAGRGKSM